MSNDAESPLVARIAEQERMLEIYRTLIGRLAVAPDKAQAWYMAKAWSSSSNWREIGFDLKTPQEQQAFLFG